MSFSFLLALFAVITPIFGKSIDYQESIVLYGGIVLFYLFSFRKTLSPKKSLTGKFLLFEIILTSLFLLSTIFSKNIGFSYYALIKFIFSIVFLNLCLLYLNSTKLSKFIFYFSLFYSLIFILNKFNFLHLTTRPFFDNFILQVWGHSYLADFLILAIPPLLYQLLNNSLKGKRRFFTYSSLFFLLIIIILTNSRSAVVALIIGSIFLYLPRFKKIYLPLIVLPLIFLTIFFINQFLFKTQNPNLKSWDGSRLEYWQQSVRGFLNNPILGQGPGNFFYVNKLYQSYPFSNTNYTHNSILEYLCLNGFPFTLIFFLTIFISLKHQFLHSPINFAIGITALTNSLLDPSWNSLGIFCLSLFYIFSQNPVIISITTKTQTRSLSFLRIFTLIFISLFFITKTASDFLFLAHKNLPSLYLDPFNLDNRQLLFPRFASSTFFFYQHNIFLYQYLAKTIPLPQSENSYYQIFSLDPLENLDTHYQLANYYFLQNNSSKFNRLISLTNHYLDVNRLPISQTMSIAKIAYKQAIFEWKHQNRNSAITNLQIALRFSKGWSYFHIELANAYWHNSQEDLAKKQLTTECQKSTSSIKHCQEYLQQHPQNLLEPGSQSIQESINNIITY